MNGGYYDGVVWGACSATADLRTGYGRQGVSGGRGDYDYGSTVWRGVRGHSGGANVGGHYDEMCWFDPSGERRACFRVEEGVPLQRSVNAYEPIAAYTSSYGGQGTTTYVLEVNGTLCTQTVTVSGEAIGPPKPVWREASSIWAGAAVEETVLLGGTPRVNGQAEGTEAGERLLLGGTPQVEQPTKGLNSSLDPAEGQIGHALETEGVCETESRKEVSRDDVLRFFCGNLTQILEGLAIRASIDPDGWLDQYNRLRAIIDGGGLNLDCMGDFSGEEGRNLYDTICGIFCSERLKYVCAERVEDVPSERIEDVCAERAEDVPSELEEVCAERVEDVSSERIKEVRSKCGANEQCGVDEKLAENVAGNACINVKPVTEVTKGNACIEVLLGSLIPTGAGEVVKWSGSPTETGEQAEGCQSDMERIGRLRSRKPSLLRDFEGTSYKTGEFGVVRPYGSPGVRCLQPETKYRGTVCFDPGRGAFRTTVKRLQWYFSGAVMAGGTQAKYSGFRFGSSRATNGGRGGCPGPWWTPGQVLTLESYIVVWWMHVSGTLGRTVVPRGDGQLMTLGVPSSFLRRLLWAGRVS